MSAAPDEATTHPRHELTDSLTHPVRFSIMAALAQVEEIDFKTLRDHLQLSDSVLSKQVAMLEGAGFVRIRKGFIGKRPRTWLTMNKRGESAWKTHLQALRSITEFQAGHAPGR